jgi:hypothetical protein
VFRWRVRASLGSAIVTCSPGTRAGGKSDKCELNDFLVFWTKLGNVHDASPLNIALRRFSYATERRRPEDQLIDLMIAAESLFLSDATSKERGELRFRLALRAAFFVEVDGLSQKDLFRFMRYVYDSRSAVVHGRPFDESALKLPGKGRVSLRDFMSFAEQVMRTALVRAVQELGLDRRRLVDPEFWESLIIR